MFKRIKIWKNHYKVWKEWSKVSESSRYYKLAVLLKWRKSLSFEVFKAEYVLKSFLRKISEVYDSIKYVDGDANLFSEGPDYDASHR